MSYPERIAQVIGKMWAGGVEAVVFNYYRFIDHDKYQFDFYYDEDSTVEPPQELIDMGARFYKLPPYQRLPEYLSSLRRFLREGNYNIVHSHLNTISVFPLFAAWKEQIPIRIAHNHSVPGGKEYSRNALKNILRHFSRLFANEYCACSEIAGRWLFGDKLYDYGRITVLKNAVDFEKFKVGKEIEKQKRAQLGIPDGSLVVGHIGRFTAAKNHQKVVSIFEAVKRKNPNSVLLLVGDGEEHDSIVARIEKDAIENCVYMTGKVSDPQNYYPLIDVLILPSVFEGVPVTVVEAQVSKTPCVISNVVNKDVVISDGCVSMNTEDSDDNWADQILEIRRKAVMLDERANAYNIRHAVKDLEMKYDKLLGR